MSTRKSAVYLVDHRGRDLMGAALVAHHLEALGIDCRLEPIEAYRGCLAAHRPDMIVFNHLFAGHLVDYSKRLQQMGVAVGLLLNEGLVDNQDFLDFASGKYHRPQVDLFMCWNQRHYHALKDTPQFGGSVVAITGTPRFDYYFPPYSAVYRNPYPASWQDGQAKIILACTNFGFAPYHELPKRHLSFADSWASRLPSYKENTTAARAAIHHAARERFFAFADALLEDPQYRLAIRPHPRETHTRYHQWINDLAPAKQARVCFVPHEEIAALINACDAHLSCDTCTTALECWIAGKPTISLHTSSDPIMVNPEQLALSTVCETPAQLVPLLGQVLQSPQKGELLEQRARYVETFCGTPDGRAAARVAEAIHSYFHEHPAAPNWQALTSADRRRGRKLLALKKMDLPYNFDPLIGLKRRLAAKRYAPKIAAHDKAIVNSQVQAARDLIARGLQRK